MTAIPPLICFDCDGVLVDSEPLAAQCMADLLATHGIAMSWQEASRLFTGKSQDSARAEIRAAFGVDLAPEDLSRSDADLFRRLQTSLQPVQGIEQVLGSMTGPVCVTSNSNHRRLEISLGHTGLAGYFGKSVFSAEDVAQGKPAPDLFHFAARSMGTVAAACLVIDDSVSGIAGAVAAGARAIGFMGGGHITPGHDEALIAAGASTIAETARDLPAAIARLTGAAFPAM
ncbi:HAD family hydrolase [Pseudooceanicola sp. C21-150M6]|uniref:HAD family hydrolase n=1 Tax=Pseudooceanicola sp. C21-150M6 TaxID=3434355 RepID=UPI003D7F5544